MKRDIFKERKAYKPYEYPELIEYANAIRRSYWIVDEFNANSDLQDFKTLLNGKEKTAIHRAMLAIAQVEVNVKKFWAKVGDNLPKPEIYDVGYCFSDSEFRHSEAYAKLLEVLGLNDDFELLLKNPIIEGRVNYLDKYIKKNIIDEKKLYVLNLILFTLFVENVSLFSQFAIIESFNKHKNVLKVISNIVEASRKEEQVHFLFGVKLINIIKEENPTWFDKDFYDVIHKACLKAYKSEIKILNWIFEKGEVDFVPIESLDMFIKNRFNESLEAIGATKLFDIDNHKLDNLKWFNEEIYAYIRQDFFYKQSVNYSKRVNSITENDLF